MTTEAQPAERFRLFIAVRIPEPVKDEIEKAQGALRDALRTNTVRWTTREQFHLTLKFLGNVEAQRAGSLVEALRLACRGFTPLALRARGLGFFPERGFPRVVWAGAQDDKEQLPRLQRAIEETMRDFTTEAAERNFFGHVTLGRIKGIRRPESEALVQAAAGMAQRVFGEWTAGEVELIRSELSPAGAKYTSLAAAMLA